MKKIDFVILWVDGSDPDWISCREATLPNTNFKNAQFRDWDILKYWFRGVEEFAPWVNNIYFVTWGHIPYFLNVDHPKVKIIKHTDYIPSQYLPTFNSHTIELNLHRISGLSENFVYFNDDQFLVNHVHEEDFFCNGKPKDVAILNPIVPSNYHDISGIMSNNISLVNEKNDYRKSIKRNCSKWFNIKYRHLNLLNLMFMPWKNMVGLYQQHIPSSLTKATMEKLWSEYPSVFDFTCSNKLRNVKTDVNQWVFKEWDVATGNFEPRDIKFGKYIMVKNEDSVTEVDKALNGSRKTKLACINDHLDDNQNDVIEKIQQIFSEKFPRKSSFEL